MELLNGQCYSARAIALRLDRSNKTIYRDFNRLTLSVLRALTARRCRGSMRPVVHKFDFAMKIKIDHELKNVIPNKLLDE
ncbi:hypothetical protein [Microbulbifer sp. GL-2]|uniref:hypothetical protein n=1 Tax=Microbulbifer sp. GL-2 TaxID=2591606 RepID=UPI00351AA6BE